MSTDLPAAPAALDPTRIRAISIDLDDTLWPIWPTIERAEAALHAWLAEHAPATAAWGATPEVIRSVRNHIGSTRPDLAHDMSALRRESIRLMLQCAGDDTALAEPAFEVFFAERQRVEFYEDALPALEWLGSRFPLVAVSNGNARLDMTGGHQFFTGAISAADAGIAKPEAAIFHAAADMVSVRPEQMLHVGDNFELDVVGARNAGLQAAWLVRQEQGLPPRMEYADHMTVSCLLTLCAALGRKE
mgnify:FL=1